MNTRSLRFRLLAWFGGVWVLVTIGFGLVLYGRLQNFLVEVQRQSLSARTEQIAQMLSNVEKTGEFYVSAHIQSRLAPELNDKFVRVTRADGFQLFLSGLPNERSFDPAAIPRLGSSPKSESLRRESGYASDVVIIARAVQAGNGTRYLVEVGSSMQASDRILRNLLKTLAASLPVVLGLAVFGGYVLTRRALDPVQNLMRVAQEITLQNLSRRLPVPPTGDEIAHLSLVLNQMIARLDESFQHTSRFTADASHELRTPLTVLRGELETMLLHGSPPSETRRILESALEEIERLVKIVEGLFAIARLDTGAAQMERVRFDLAGLAESTVEQMCLLAEEKRIHVTVNAPERVEVEGDRSRLKQVVVNLFDNAVKYTPEGGAVEIAVQRQGHHAELRVADSGPGAPAAALPHLFERFYRADSARTREVGGAGLGLAIVHSICQAHGGTITAENRKPHGFQITVRLPAAQ